MTSGAAAAPVGPRRLTTVRQVAIPASLLEAVGLEIGSLVYFEIRADDPRVIRILPADQVTVVP